MNNFEFVKTLRSSRSWKKLRMSIIRKANFICQICERPYGRLEVDHVTPIKELFRSVSTDGEKVEAFYSSEGCQVLCRPCHEKKTEKENRKIELSHDEITWREYTGVLK